MKIEIKILYENGYGDMSMIKRTANDFESASESLGKLEIGIENEKKNLVKSNDLSKNI